jgi:hypothetical protein
MARHGGAKALRVRVAGPVEDPRGRSGLDDGAMMHDERPVADLPNDCKVVRDEEVRDPAGVADVGEKVEDLRLDRDVESGDRFVQDEQAGLGGQSPGDRDPLALPAGKVVRAHASVLCLQSYLVQQLGDARGARPAISAEVLVDDLGDAGSDALLRVE